MVDTVRQPKLAVVSKADASGGGASRVAQDLAEMLNRGSNFSCHHWLGYAGNGWQAHYRGLHGGPKLRLLQQGVSWFSLKAGFPDFFTPEIFIHYLKKSDDYSLYHFHDISRTFSPVAMRWLATRKPVVWTLHDCCSFTGGCLYPMDCDAFTKGCGNCPQLDVWPLRTPFDRTHWMHTFKKKTALAGLITPIAPSNWIADEAFRSGMFESRPEVIPYSVDSQTFRPLARKQIRQELSLPPDRFVALLNVHNIADPRKGVRDAIAATRQLEGKPLLAALGTVDAAARREFEGLDARFLGYVADRTQLAKYCAAADILLFPTYADNLPNAVLEALASGTPTVGYATGGMPDMVEHGVNGWLAAPGDVDGLAQGIDFCRNNPDTLMAWSKRSRELAVSEFSEELFIDAHGRLYATLLEQHAVSQAGVQAE